jgi:hypothetical protein
MSQSNFFCEHPYKRGFVLCIHMINERYNLDSYIEHITIMLDHGSHVFCRSHWKIRNCPKI